MKAGIFLAEGFEIAEALCPLDVLRRAGIEIELIGSNTVTGPSDGNGEVDEFSSYGIFAEEGELTARAHDCQDLRNLQRVVVERSVL